MELNTLFVKIKSRMEIPHKDFKLGDELNILVKGEVVKVEELSNQNGEMDRVLVVKPIINEIKE